MHLEQTKFLQYTRLKLSIIVALIVAQPALFSYLLALDISETILLTLLCGIPVALISSFLLTSVMKLHYCRMSIVMFAAGGFGMAVLMDWVNRVLNYSFMTTSPYYHRS